MPVNVSRRWKIGLTIVVVAVGITGGAAYRFVVADRPPGVMQDLRAGLAARSIQDPDERLAKYLEGRYGNLEDPAIRESVFVDFFNPERIRVLQWLVRHVPEERRQGSIDAMARWVARYRTSLGPEERASLNARFQTPEGRAVLARATAQYNAQDVHYRGQTAAVISELLRTLNEVEQAP